jgi:tetratricopeptide (TPR) repeat protein
LVWVFGLVLGLPVIAAAQEVGETQSTNPDSSKPDPANQPEETLSEATESNRDSLKTETSEPKPDKPLAELSIDELKARLEVEPKNDDIKILLATKLSWQDKRKQARELALQIVDVNPEYFDAQILIARLDFWDGQHQAALERIKWVLDRSPKNEDALRLWAQIQIAVAYKLSWKNASRDRARDMALEVVQAIHDYWDAHVLLSRIDLWDGRFEDAFVRISMVRAHQPNNDEVFLVWKQTRLAQAQQLWADGENAKARQIALQITETDADNWDAHLLIARIDAQVADIMKSWSF